MMPPNPEEWVTPQVVTRFVAEQLWEKFPFPQKQGNQIVWEYGILEAIVDVAIHSRQNAEGSTPLIARYVVKEPKATGWIIENAIRRVNTLAKSRRAFLLMLLGVGNFPIPKELTKNGAIEEHAAKIYGTSQEEFHRAFERARDSFRKWIGDTKRFTEQRLKQIPQPGTVTKQYPDIASKYPLVFQRLDDLLREKRGSSIKKLGSEG